MRKKIVLSFFAFIYLHICFAQNFLSNGNFENGGVGTGFAVTGVGYTQLIPPFSGTTTAGNYAITTNPQPLNTSNFISGTDHTTGSGNMLVIDGNSVAGQQYFWEAGNLGSGVSGLQPGSTYKFSYWIKSVSNTVTDAATSANINVQIDNATAVTLASGNALAPLPNAGWQKVTYSFTATNTTVYIKLWNSNTNLVGNDFAIDDLSVYTCSMNLISNNSNQTVCTGQAINSILYSYSGAVSGISVTGLPTGVTYSIANNIITISGTPNVSITSQTDYNYTVSVVDEPCAGLFLTGLIKVNPLPNLSIVNIVQTICPGNTANITMNGTPNSVVTIMAVGQNYTGNIGATGTGIFTTPPLQNDTTFSFNLITSNSTGCSRSYNNITIEVKVVANGCANFIPSIPNLNIATSTSTNILGCEMNISATIPQIKATTTYSVSSIPYCPRVFPDPSGGFTQINVPNADDQWSEVVNLPFQFCFWGNNYTSCSIGTNGLISFNPHTLGSFCDWPDTNVGLNNGNTTFNQKNAIFGVFQDTDFRTSSPAASPPDRSVSYKIEGTYPCRKLIVNFYHMGQWQCNQSVGLQTSQIILYEISNIIEVFVERRVPCTSAWNGTGLIGIINQSGSQALAAPGRDGDDSQWSAFNEGWRFTPTGVTVPNTFQWFQGTTSLGNNPNITISPTTPTTYTAVSTYTVCGVQKVISKDYHINIVEVNQPQNLVQCVNNPYFNLNTVIQSSLQSVLAAGYTVTTTFHHTYNEAELYSDPQNPHITNTSNYFSNGNETIFVRFEFDTGCILIKQFQLQLIPSQVPTISCGTNTPSSIAFNWNSVPNAIGYNISYQKNIEPPVNVGFVDSSITSYTFSSGINTSTSITITVTPISSGSDCFASASLTCNAASCPTITNPSSTQNLCLGSDMNPLSVNTTFTGTDAISYVYFTSPQSGSSMYTGGIPLGYATPDAATLASYDPPVLGSVGSLPNSVGTYYIYAIANPIPADGTCRPYQEIVVVISTPPNAGFDGTLSICDTSTTAINLYNLIVGEDSGGTWIRTSGTGGLFDSVAATFTPAVGATNSTFEYSLPSTAICAGDTSIATVDISHQPTAGTGSTHQSCTTDTNTLTLANYISGEDTGGVWTQISGTGGTFNASSGTFIPTGATTSIFQYTITPGAPCSDTNSLVTINIPNPPTPITPTAYHVCDDNTDGYATFTLSTKDAEITGGNTNYTVTYHATQPAADAGTPVLPNSYSNNIANSQTVYIRVVDNTTGCYATTTLQLVVDQKPQVTTSSAGVCIGNNATVSTTVSPAGTYNYVWTYPAGASDPGNVSTFTTSVAGTYTVVATNTTTGCSSNATPVTVTIYPLPVIVTPSPMTMCSNGSSNQAIFNLPLNDSTITNGASGLTVTYYNSQADADAETNAITPSNTYLGTHGETIYVRVEDNLTSCYATTTLLLQVTQGPVANTPSPLERCDDNNDGYNIFTLSNATAQIVGGSLPPGVSVSYHLTQDDATLGANPLGNSYSNNTPWTQTIYVRVYYTLTGCANYVQLQLIVHPSPEATIPSDYHACDDNADGVTAFNLSTKINEILGSINPATHTVHFYTDQPSAEAGGTNYISNVTNYFNTTPNTQTLWVRVENIATGCYDVVPLVLVVDPLPIVLTPHYQQFEMCDYTGAVGFENFDLNSQVAYILQGQTGMQVDFYPSYTDAVNNTNVITNTASYQNLYPYVHTLGIRVTNTTTGCYSISTMDLYVNELPSPVAPTQPLAVCDTDQNNWAIFNLCDPTFLSTIQQGENYILTFHATIPDAQLGLNQLPCQYNNNNAAVQIIYIRAEDPDTGCYSIVPLELNAHPKPYMPVLTNLEVCDYIGNTQDGYAYFNLSLQTPAILAANTPSSNYTVTYYNNQINASASPNGILPISQITNYFGHNGDTIWVRVQNNSTGCFTVSSFQLIVHAPLVLTTPTLYKVCDTDTTPNDNYTSFNILSFIGPIAGYTINLYADAAHTQPISSPFTNTLPANQTIFWTATNNTTGCISSRTLTLTVLPVPTPNTNLSAPQYLIHSCDSNSPNDGFEIFNLTVNANYILNGDTNTELHYYPSLVDAENGTNEITNPTAANVNGDVYIRVQWKPAPVTSFIDSNNQYCHVIVKQPVKVYPLPLMYANKQFQICDNDTDGFAVFDLTSYTDDLLMNTTGITFANTTFVFSNASGVISNPAAYTNTTNPETITVTATSSASPLNCSYTQTFSIIVNPNPTVTPPATWKTCDTLDPTDTVNYPNDGYYNHDLAALIPGILNGQADTDFTVTFYHTEADAIAATNGITNLSGYMAQTETIWIRVTNNTTGCYIVGSTNFVVEQLPEPVIKSDNGMHVICVDYRSLMVLRPLQLQIHNLTEDTPYLHGTPTYTYQWYEGNTPIPGETNSTYDVPPSATGAIRNYKVEMTTTTPGLGCSYTSVQAFTVIQSGPATPTVIGSTGYTVTNAFTENQTITVDVDGWGKYEYSLDDGPRQTSPIFENVSLGEHFITVWDIKAGNESCDPFLIQKVRTIDYPHYFTPNGDGFNDYWNINGLQGQYAKIYLFDRFGKLIKQLSPDTQGWDGTYNGNPLPATDYWFTVEYFELNTTKTFKAHFSLKR